LPESVKAGLKQVEESLKSVDPSCAKWIDPDSIHLTLVFLGNVDINKIESITQSMKKAAQTTPPFNLALDELGAFPDLRRAQVVWVGLQGDLEVLQTLQKRIETNLVPLGFPPENRAFKPHLTLARVREITGPQIRQSLGEKISLNKIESKSIIRVDSISLMRSELTRSGAIYTRLCSVELRVHVSFVRKVCQERLLLLIDASRNLENVH
jgi:RNA 2',3'-cyclic 3'-phosphodiesterase